MRRWGEATAPQTAPPFATPLPGRGGRMVCTRSTSTSTSIVAAARAALLAVLAPAVALVGAAPSSAPIPGLSDVCAHLSTDEKCSPEICSMKPHAQVLLGASVYYVDKEVQLPEGAELRGAGVNKTRIVSCGAPSSGRRTLVLGNNTYIGHFTFQGLQARRGNFEGAVGTPGCLATDCAATAASSSSSSSSSSDPAAVVACFLRGGVTIAKCPHQSIYDTWLLTGGKFIKHAGLNCYWGHGATWGTGDLTTSSKTYTVSTCEAACRNNSLCDAVTVGVSKTGRPACIPADGDCAGVQNATAEYIHVDGYVSADGKQRWPLSIDGGWFPNTLPWGPDQKTGSRDITVRGMTAWGTWADGINFHGGHHNVLIEDCELSYTGDDPIGLWPVSAEAKLNPNDCQHNIVVRNNTARWPRQYPGQQAGSNGSYARDEASCNCADWTVNGTKDPGCWGHFCYASYAAGEGVAFVNNRCEGARGVIAFNGGFPNPKQSQWCGRLTVVGNTYEAMSEQGSDCRLENSTESMCSAYLPPPGVIGRQCSAQEAALPPPCANKERFSVCSKAPGMAAICYGASAADGLRCVSASELALNGTELCSGFSQKCTIFGGYKAS